jgi:hypothetical protein
VKNLSELKKYLALPKAALRMTNLEWYDGREYRSQTIKLELQQFRFVGKLQTNRVALETDNTESGLSWLDFGKASEWAFDTSTNTAVNLSGGTRITYKWANVAIPGGVDIER